MLLSKAMRSAFGASALTHLTVVLRAIVLAVAMLCVNLNWKRRLFGRFSYFCRNESCSLGIEGRINRLGSCSYR